MKKKYVMPTIEVLALQAENLMLQGRNSGVGDGEVDPLTNKKEQDRNWGRDLWGEKE